MASNHYKRWSSDDIHKLRSIASTLKSKEEMYNVSSSLAKRFGRTEASVCKKIEEFNGWFWAAS